MKKYKYSMKHQWITTSYIGRLMPCFLQDVTPGDVWKGRSSSVFRLAPLDVPTFMQLNIFTKYFFVPYRLIFDDFEDFITGADPNITWPTLPDDEVSRNWSMFGVTKNNDNEGLFTRHSALPTRAYNLVYNEFFRPHLHVNEAQIDAGQIHRVYFPESEYYGSMKQEIQQDDSEVVDVSGSTLPVTEIRDAFNRQRLKERRSQYGERYRDMLISDYGVRPPDSRLDRPEYLTGAKTTIGVSEVVATASSESENTGEMRGHGIAGMTTKFPARRFNEHGLIIGVMYSRPRFQLRERVDHMFHLRQKEDLYIPSLASDTMITVKASEVWPHGNGVDNDYAYMDRYDHLRMPRDTIAGAMTFPNMNSWTATPEYDNIPPVSYMQQVQDYDNIFQDQTTERYDIQAYFAHNIGKLSVVKPRNKR